jgi:hypothetical protein
MLIPMFGTFSCESSESGTIIHQARGVLVVDCGKNEYTDNCLVTVRLPNVGSSVYSRRITVYKYSSSGDVPKYMTIELERMEPDNQIIFSSEPLLRRESFEFDFEIQKLGGWEIDTSKDIVATKTYDKYYLYREDGNGYDSIANKMGCFINKDMKLCVEGKDCQYRWDNKGELGFGEVVNYFDFWDETPTEYNLVVHPSYGRVYCSGSSIYGLGTMALSNGNCYAYPASKLGTVQCCPGEEISGLLCGNDFKWIEKDYGSKCTSDLQCYGQGNWITDYTDPGRKTLVRETCNNGKCEKTTKRVACSSNEACPSSQVCIIDQIDGTSRCADQAGVGELPDREVIGDTGGEKRFDFILFLKRIFLGAIVSTAILGIAILLSFILPMPFRMIAKPLMNIRTFMIVWLILTIFLSLIFTAPLLWVASIIGV